MTTSTTVKLSDLEYARMFVDAGRDFDARAWVCRATGEVFQHNDDYDGLEELPDDIDDETLYVAVPTSHELDLGKPLVLDFTRAHLPDCLDEVEEIFSRRGAYARFKNPLERRDSLDAWHRWEEEHSLQALREWCKDNDISLVD